MTTVEALKKLGEALVGDDFKVDPGLTDAEMIYEIAKQFKEKGGLYPAEGLYPVDN